AEERQAVADGLLIQPLIGNLPNIMAPEWFDGLKRAAEPLRGHDVGQVADQRLDQQAVSHGLPFLGTEVRPKGV
ncbi:hypothetical protein, partial [Aeromonas caviae]|uniref:hypothetical protein n=1 Tax=Aeromonas caviae TaxID=648 RepID=UPI00403A21CC